MVMLGVTARGYADATVDTRKFYGGSSANGHYGGNGEFIMQVGDEMGKAMVELLKKKK